MYSRHFCSDFGQVVYLSWLRSTQPFILNWWINRVPAGLRAGDAASAGWRVTVYDPIWHASCCSGANLLAQTAILLYLTFTTCTSVYWLFFYVSLQQPVLSWVFLHFYWKTTSGFLMVGCFLPPTTGVLALNGSPNQWPVLIRLLSTTRLPLEGILLHLHQISDATVISVNY